MNPRPLTHAELVQISVRWLRTTRGCGVVLAEMVCANRLNIIPDALGWRAAAWSILVECKTSRADFLADRKKPIHQLPDSGPGQERWYITPPNLIKPEELPIGWCLAEVHGTRVKLIHPTKLWGGAVEGLYFNHERQASEVPFLLSACRRHQLSVPFYSKTAKFKPVDTHSKPVALAETEDP